MSSRQSIGDGRCLRDTGKAMLIDLENAGVQIWIPHSVIHDDSEVFDADDNSEGEVFVASWWAEKERLV